MITNEFGKFKKLCIKIKIEVNQVTSSSTLQNGSKDYEIIFNKRKTLKTFSNYLNKLHEKIKNEINNNIESINTKTERITYLESLIYELSTLKKDYIKIDLTNGPHPHVTLSGNYPKKHNDLLIEDMHNYFIETDKIIKILNRFVHHQRGVTARYRDEIIKKNTEELAENGTDYNDLHHNGSKRPLTTPSQKAIYPKKHQTTPNGTSGGGKLQWNGPANQLVRWYYDLNRKKTSKNLPQVGGTPSEIEDHIVNNWLDKDGNDISRETVKTYLKPNRTDKRAPDHKRIDIEPYCVE